MDWIVVFSDLRAMTGLSVAILGGVFLAYAHRDSWPYVRWMAGSALAFGLLQLAYRLLELLDSPGIGPRGEASTFLSVPCLAALLVGLHTYLSPRSRHAVRRFWLLNGVGLLWSALAMVWLHAEPLRGPIATAGMLLAAALWLAWRWWRDRWAGQLVLALSFLSHPALLLLTQRNALDAAGFRQLTPLPSSSGWA